MLTRARDLVREQGVISLQEVALKLGVPSQVARAMLHKWVAKGRIEQLPTTTACAGCSLCDGAPRELYYWPQAADRSASNAWSAAQSEPSCCLKPPTDARPPESAQGQVSERSSRRQASS
ncbi:FeoC-like transcriptional regulator [Halochromatium roseum]|uniref:FeoC-like transcriptional regulator n=1 Tax=Halochromatium roseum TaxID=391920 RepID=UPI0019132C1C|nr:hypothetical protein [Halochromatium roseum]